MPARSSVAPTLDDLRQYARLFVNRWDAFMDHTPTGGWRCRHLPLTKDRLVAALAGQTGSGFYRVDRYGYSRWLWLDLDDADRGAQLRTGIDQLDP